MLLCLRSFSVVVVQSQCINSGNLTLCAVYLKRDLIVALEVSGNSYPFIATRVY